MTILSQFKLVVQGATITKQIDDTYHFKLPRRPVVVIFSWVDGILARSLDEPIK